MKWNIKKVSNFDESKFVKHNEEQECKIVII